MQKAKGLDELIVQLQKIRAEHGKDIAVAAYSVDGRYFYDGVEISLHTDGDGEPYLALESDSGQML